MRKHRGQVVHDEDEPTGKGYLTEEESSVDAKGVKWCEKGKGRGRKGGKRGG